jgi:hypothetical protein
VRAIRALSGAAPSVVLIAGLGLLLRRLRRQSVRARAIASSPGPPLPPHRPNRPSRQPRRPAALLGRRVRADWRGLRPRALEPSQKGPTYGQSQAGRRTSGQSPRFGASPEPLNTALSLSHEACEPDKLSDPPARVWAPIRAGRRCSRRSCAPCRPPSSPPPCARPTLQVPCAVLRIP